MRGIKIFIHDPEAGRTREERYSRSPIKIGRNPNNDLNLNFGFVSSWHAEVEFDARGGAVRDLGSTNGSAVEGRRLEPQARVPLREGLVMTIGRLEIRFAFEEIEQDNQGPEAGAPQPRASGRGQAGANQTGANQAGANQAGANQAQGHPQGHGGPSRAPRQMTMPIAAVPDVDPGGSGVGPPPMGPPPINQMAAAGPSLSPSGPPRMPTAPPSMQPQQQGPPNLQGNPNMQGPPPLRPNPGMPAMQGPPMMSDPIGSGGPPHLGLGGQGQGLPSQEPPKPKVSGAEATGFVDLGGVHRAMRELRPAYEQFASARKLFQDQVDVALGKLSASTRDVGLAFFRREFPEMPGATPFAAPTTPPSGGSESSTSVQRFAVALLGNVTAPTSIDEEVAFLARVAEVLQTSAQAFIEIRNVQSRFGEEMGVRTIREYTPLHGAADARGVLDYLLDWRRGGPERNAQLSAVYSDFMLHQVALINGVVEGVQGLLDQFRPQEIERGVGGLNKAGSAWKKYAERYAEMIEDRGIAALVFGPEFSRAYAEVGGNS